MKRFFIVLVVALITVAVLLLIYNPGLLEKIWLWIIGLIGAIVAFLERSYKTISKKIKQFSNKSAESKQHTSEISPVTYIHLLRLRESDETTFGLFYVNENFLAFSIEDRADMMESGTYRLGWSNDIPANDAYRQFFPWFDRHPEIKSDNNGKSAIVHIGGTGQEIPNSIILTNEINPELVSVRNQELLQIYQAFYRELRDKLMNGIPVILKIENKNWFTDKFN